MASLGRYSRRHLLCTVGAGVALWPTLAGAQSPLPAPPEGENIQGHADLSNRLTVEASIDGKGPYRFIVDTGADRTIIASDVAASLGLIAGEDVMVQGIARALPAATVRLRNLRLGRITLDSLPTPVLPREWLAADGYLGIDAIDGRRVTFDFQNRALTVTRSSYYSDRAGHDEALVRVAGNGGRLTDLNCRVDGARAFAFVDSGAQISIANTRLFAALAANGASYLSDVRIPLYGVTGGNAQGRLMSVSKIALGGLTFTNVLLVICDLAVFDAWGLADRPALFIGMNLLQMMSVFIIDYGRKELLFKLAQVQVASRT
jgi:predicted aspartyl protease